MTKKKRHIDYPIGSRWTDTSKNPEEIYELHEDQWKFIGYRGKDTAGLGWIPRKYISVHHKKDIKL